LTGQHCHVRRSGLIDRSGLPFYSDRVAAPKGLIGKSVECRHAPRHCKEAMTLFQATARAGRPGPERGMLPSQETDRTAAPCVRLSSDYSLGAE
jgi:hypothetical protein